MTRELNILVSEFSEKNKRQPSQEELKILVELLDLNSPLRQIKYVKEKFLK